MHAVYCFLRDMCYFAVHHRSYSQKAYEEPQVIQGQSPRGRFSRHVLTVLPRNRPLVELFSDFLDGVYAKSKMVEYIS